MESEIGGEGRQGAIMEGVNKKDMKAAHDTIKVLLNILPKTESAIHNIVYTCGLISREVGIPEEQAAEVIMSWSERLRALPNFRELYPIYKKPSFYKYQIRYAVKSAYIRTQDKPSSHWFEALTGKKAPAASFWNTMPLPSKKKRPRNTAT